MSDSGNKTVQHLNHYLVPHSLDQPVVVKGEGATVEDDRGRRYLDLEAGPGVVSVGHCHPKIVDAVRTQVGKLTQSPGRRHSLLTLRLAERLARLTKGRLKRTFFANSGAEANDGAVKIALKHAVAKGKRGFGILSLKHSFHGRLALPVALTGMAERKKGFGPYGTFPGVVHVATPYCYRCPLGLSYPSCGVQCADSIEEDLKTSVPGEAAVMVAEPILGVGGVIVPPPEYWSKVQDICRRHDIALVHDEVFTGFGRTGKFFAYEHYGTKPDVVTFAKAVGGGVPLGGFLATEDVGTAFDKNDHFSTFGGNNQIGIAACHAVLDILHAERLPENAEKVGSHFLEGLRNLAQRYEVIGDVRGRGLMIGIELVRDRETKAPAPDLAQRLKQELQERNVLVTISGVYGCVVRITPPLVINQAQVEAALEAIESSLAVISPA
jgi:4-aminobutyrate aminotransferase-like enzyme